MTAKLEETLSALFAAASAHTEHRIANYALRGQKASRVARRLRRLSLFLFILGTMAPVLETLVSKLDKAKVPPADLWARLAPAPWTEGGYVLLAIAGGLVLYDQFFGDSVSWIRYRKAEARLTILLADLRYGWAEALAKAGGNVAVPAAAARLVGVLESHVHRVEALAETETDEWATQFRAQIDAFDRKLQAKQDENAARKAGEAKARDAEADGKKRGGAKPAAKAKAGKPAAAKPKPPKAP